MSCYCLIQRWGLVLRMKRSPTPSFGCLWIKWRNLWIQHPTSMHAMLIPMLNNNLEGDDKVKSVVDLPQMSGDKTCAKETNEDGNNQFAVEKPCKNNDPIWTIQLEWICKLHWVEGTFKYNWKPCMVICNVCSITNKERKWCNLSGTF